MLLDPLEEQFYPPAKFVQVRNDSNRQSHVVRNEYEREIQKSIEKQIKILDKQITTVQENQP